VTIHRAGPLRRLHCPESMARFALAGVVAGLLLVLSACGGGGGAKTYTLASTKSCLVKKGARLGGKLDFVAETATGGALISRLSDNFVTIAFGQTLTDGQQLELAYERFAFQNVRSGLADILRRYGNAVTLWHAHPSDSDLSLVVGCLH
jgi:hypothetical protein